MNDVERAARRKPSIKQGSILRVCVNNFSWFQEKSMDGSLWSSSLAQIKKGDHITVLEAMEQPSSSDFPTYMVLVENKILRLYEPHVNFHVEVRYLVVTNE